MLLHPEVKTIETDYLPIDFGIDRRMKPDTVLRLAGRWDLSYQYQHTGWPVFPCVGQPAYGHAGQLANRPTGQMCNDIHQGVTICE